MTSFFEMHRDWPEGYASLTIKRAEDIKISHLSVYEKPCNDDYLRKFRIVHFKHGYIPDLLPNNLGWYLASPRLCIVLKNIDSEIKAFMQPIANMQFPSCPETVTSYSLVSAARVLDCLDSTSSALTWFNAERTSLKKYTHLSLRRDHIPAAASFFAVAKVVSTFVVSNVIQKAILDGKFSGVAFRQCELV